MEPIHEIRAQVADLDCIHDVIIGLYSALEDHLRSEVAGGKGFALMCALRHYLEEMGEFIEKLEKTLGEDAQ